MHDSPLAFPRQDDGRAIAGVAGGFARRHGLDPLVVRGALVVLSFAAGLGLVLYVAGAALSTEPDPNAATQPPDARRNVSVALIAAGLLLVVRSTGVWLGDAVMVPLAVLAAGVVVLGVVRSGGDDATETQLAGLVAGRHARLRVMLGALLLAVGLVSVGAGRQVSTSVRVGVFAAALSIVGVALLLGPWVAGFAQSAAEERRERIRAQEREAMAAHLHDSVLQTLALIQRTADDPRRTASLARQQEHELRAWLFGGGDAVGATFASALRAMAFEVEQRHDVRVEVVTVGDTPLDEVSSALLAATREACVNAAKHSGVQDVSVYAEVAVGTPGAGTLECFVRDRGRGFDPTLAAPDRHGITQSIEARLERVGGGAVIDSAPDQGTEVHLSVPLRVDAGSGVVS
jgi:signal transduction histidine kinase